MMRNEQSQWLVVGVLVVGAILMRGAYLWGVGDVAELTTLFRVSLSLGFGLSVGLWWRSID